jgi:hypothetical protein
MIGARGFVGLLVALQIRLPRLDSWSHRSLKRRGRRVLIIEDNVDAAESLREVLQFGEHVVEVAHDGPKGLARAREFRPDVGDQASQTCYPGLFVQLDAISLHKHIHAILRPSDPPPWPGLACRQEGASAPILVDF